MTHGSAVKSVAAMIGSTAFLAPLMVTSPCRGTPPFTKRLSMLGEGDFESSTASIRVFEKQPSHALYLLLLLCIYGSDLSCAITILGRRV